MQENANPKKFFLLDLDRCLLDLNETMRRYNELVAQQYSSIGPRLDRASRTAVANGDSFDTYKYLAVELGDRAVEELDAMFVKSVENSDLLNPGAKELMEYLALSEHEYGILTYGSLRWQKFKLRASRLDCVPHLVTGQKEKGSLIASWQQPSGEFIIPGQLLAHIGQSALFPSVILVDDKPDSFIGLPLGVRGYLYQNPQYEILPSQQGEVSSSVTIINNFLQVVDTEQLSDSQVLPVAAMP